MNNKYYVYEWIRLDTNEPFYVGKGKGDRWRDLTRGRNYHFNNIVKSIPIAVNILHDYLDERIAYDLECWYIWHYRDIIGYDLTNINDGGEGNSVCGAENSRARAVVCLNTNEVFKTISDAVQKTEGNITCIYECCSGRKERSGKTKDGEPLTWMFLEDYEKATEEEIEEKLNKAHNHDLRVICITTNLIFENCQKAAQYYNINKTGIAKCCNGIHKSAGKLPDGTPLIWERFITYKKMTEIDINKRIEKVKSLNKGKNHWAYGKHPTKESIEKRRILCVGKKRSEEFKESIRGKNNPNSKSVICLTTKKIFYSAKEAGKYYNIDNSSICKCCKGFIKTKKGKMQRIYYCGKLSDGTKLIWRFLIWNHNRTYRIKK